MYCSLFLSRWPIWEAFARSSVRQRQRPDPRQPTRPVRGCPALTEQGCPSSGKSSYASPTAIIGPQRRLLSRFLAWCRPVNLASAQGPLQTHPPPAPPPAPAPPRAGPAAQRAPSAARAAPRAAPAAPRQVARPPAPRPAAQAPARAPASVQRARPQRPAAVQRAQPQRPAAVQRTPQQRQVQERQLQLRARQARPQQSAPKQVEKGPSRPNVATKPSARPVARSQASDQQRREVRQRLFGNPGVQRISRSQLNVALAMGSRIPRRHRLYRFTPALLAIIPAYAAYQYLIVDDTICVVDPDSYAIVDVIPSSIEQAGPQSAERPALALSTDQMRCVMPLPRRIKPGLICASVSLSGPRSHATSSYLPSRKRDWPALPNLRATATSSWKMTWGLSTQSTTLLAG